MNLSKTVEDAYAVTKEYLDTDANIETHFDLNEGDMYPPYWTSKEGTYHLK